MRASLFAIVAVVVTVAAAAGQACPQRSRKGPTTPSEVRIFEGRLVYHDDIRKWFELKLDELQCGQASIQLVTSLDDWTAIEVLRGCRVKASGAIDFSGTGYYSLEIYQDVEEIESIGTCETQLPFPDYSSVPPDRTVLKYRVDMHINYEPGDHPIAFRVSSGSRDLEP